MRRSQHPISAPSHEKASVTLGVYGHLYTEDLEQLADRIDDRLRGVA